MPPAPFPSNTLAQPRVPSGPSQPPDDRGRTPGDDGGTTQSPLPPARIAVWLLVGGITILFAAFTSTYLARRVEADWHVGPLPSVLWVNTALLLASSGSLQWARRRAREGRLDEMRRGLALTTGLGLLFVVGQVLAWRQLVAAGIYLATYAHSAFFYLLTGMHAIHLLGGIAALLYALARVPATMDRAGALDVLEPVATYWHFVDGLWVYVFAILFLL